MSELDGLPERVQLALDFPYMVTNNIDVLDRLVNGIIGTLKYIEYDEDESEGSTIDASKINHKISTLWFEFPQENIGSVARIKCTLGHM